MHPLPQLRLNGVKRGAHPLRYGLTPCNEMAIGCHRTVVREAKKREGLWFSFPTLLPINLREPTKLDQSRLLRMEFQREACQPFPKLSQKSLGVFALLKADHQSSRPGELHPQALTDSGLERLRSSGSYRPIAARRNSGQ